MAFPLFLAEACEAVECAQYWTEPPSAEFSCVKGPLAGPLVEGSQTVARGRAP